jgi:hypothetical protein
MFSYVEGGTDAGLAIVSASIVALLARAAGPETATELYRVLEAGGEGLDLAMDLLDVRAPGISAAIVEVRDARTRVIRMAVRGDISVELAGGGSTRLGGRRHGDWSVTESVGARRFVLELPSPAVAATLPLRDGVVATDRIDFRAPTAARRKPGGLVLERESDVDPPTQPIPIIARGTRGGLARDLDASAGTRVHPEQRDHVAPVLPVSDDVPGAAWIVGLPDGTELDDRRPIVIGRRAWFTRQAPEGFIHVVVPSPRREISGEQLEIEFASGHPVARDLGSRNGSLLFSGDEPPRLIHGGESVVLSTGDIIDVGEGCRVTIHATGAPVAGVQGMATW